MKTILGIFTDREKVEMAVDQLKEDGFPVEEISIIMRDKRQAEEIRENTGTDIAGGAASGVATGALLGALAGLVGAAILPGIGAIFIGGPLALSLGLTGAAATTASGAVTGAVAGGIIGALMSLGLPKKEAVYYEDKIRNGAIVLAVPVNSISQEKYVPDLLEEYGASDIRTVAPNKRIGDAADEESENNAYPERTQQVQFSHVGAKGGKTKTRKRIV